MHDYVVTRVSLCSISYIAKCLYHQPWISRFNLEDCKCTVPFLIAELMPYHVSELLQNYTRVHVESLILCFVPSLVLRTIKKIIVFEFACAHSHACIC